jgi:hypothetical protein
MLLFNLYAYTNKERPKHIIFQPYDEFYALFSPDIIKTTALDWTNKIIYNEDFKKLMNLSIPKSYVYTYKEDKDFINQAYKTEFNDIYSTLRFRDIYGIQDLIKVETIFSPSPMVSTNERYYTQIRFNDNLQIKPISSNIRILYFNGVKDCNDYVFVYNNYVGPVVIDYYGEATEYYTPATFSETSLQWFLPNRLYFPVQNYITLLPNLYNTFHISQITELTDPDLYTLECKAILSDIDISNFDFKTPIYISTDIGNSYFKVIKISWKDNKSPASLTLQSIATPKSSNDVPFETTTSTTTVPSTTSTTTVPSTTSTTTEPSTTSTTTEPSTTSTTTEPSTTSTTTEPSTTSTTTEPSTTSTTTEPSTTSTTTEPSTTSTTTSTTTLGSIFFDVQESSLNANLFYGDMYDNNTDLLYKAVSFGIEDPNQVTTGNTASVVFYNNSTDSWATFIPWTNFGNTYSTVYFDVARHSSTGDIYVAYETAGAGTTYDYVGIRRYINGSASNTEDTYRVQSGSRVRHLEIDQDRNKAWFTLTNVAQLYYVNIPGATVSSFTMSSAYNSALISSLSINQGNGYVYFAVDKSGGSRALVQFNPSTNIYTELSTSEPLPAYTKTNLNVLTGGMSIDSSNSYLYYVSSDYNYQYNLSTGEKKKIQFNGTWSSMNSNTNFRTINAQDSDGRIFLGSYNYSNQGGFTLPDSYPMYTLFQTTTTSTTTSTTTEPSTTSTTTEPSTTSTTTEPSTTSTTTEPSTTSTTTEPSTTSTTTSTTTAVRECECYTIVNGNASATFVQLRYCGNVGYTSTRVEPGSTPFCLDKLDPYNPSLPRGIATVDCNVPCTTNSDCVSCFETTTTTTTSTTTSTTTEPSTTSTTTEPSTTSTTTEPSTTSTTTEPSTTSTTTEPSTTSTTTEPSTTSTTTEPSTTSTTTEPSTTSTTTEPSTTTTTTTQGDCLCYAIQNNVGETADGTYDDCFEGNIPFIISALGIIYVCTFDSNSIVSTFDISIYQVVFGDPGWDNCNCAN